VLLVASRRRCFSPIIRGGSDNFQLSSTAQKRVADASKVVQTRPTTNIGDTSSVVHRGRNEQTGEVGGYRGAEPTRNGDWEHKGRCTDF